MLQCASSLKQVNFKTECFSSLLVTIDTEVIIFNIWPVVNNNETQSRGGYSQKNWVGVCGPLPKTLTLFMTKICDFPYPIYDLTKNLIPYL